MSIHPDSTPQGAQVNRIPVLFIAGTGRSGSTLLDRILGMQHGFSSTGELRYIWERSFRDNQLCGCGEPFHDCTFWGEVSRRAFGVSPADFDHVNAMRLKGAADRIRYVPWLLANRRPARYQSSLLAYGALITSLYSQILRISGAQVIVDSSKDPTHGFVLSRLPGVELHVVHLVRDPRAVVFSWKRVRRRPEIHWQTQNMPIERLRTSAIRWNTHNALAELLSWPAASYRRIRYEDFLGDPDIVVSRLLELYPWTAQNPPNLGGTEVTLAPTHTVSGNPMRFKHGKLELRLDDDWRGQMPRRDQLAVSALTALSLTRYGYRSR